MYSVAQGERREYEPLALYSARHYTRHALYDFYCSITPCFGHTQGQYDYYTEPEVRTKGPVYSLLFRSIPGRRTTRISPCLLAISKVYATL